MTLLEGAWDEILAHSGDLEGKHIRLVATEQAQPGANALREAIAQARAIQAGMGTTRAGDTVAVIREGRSGAMYGAKCDG